MLLHFRKVLPGPQKCLLRQITSRLAIPGNAQQIGSDARLELAEKSLECMGLQDECCIRIAMGGRLIFGLSVSLPHHHAQKGHDSVCGKIRTGEREHTLPCAFLKIDPSITYLFTSHAKSNGKYSWRKYPLFVMHNPGQNMTWND